MDADTALHPFTSVLSGVAKSGKVSHGIHVPAFRGVCGLVRISGIRILNTDSGPELITFV